MEELLSKMDPEKRDRVINSSFEEFGKNGYDKASTNEIVKKAGISKGLLFHYFGNKQTLYQTLMDFAMDYLGTLLEEQIDWSQQDFFLRVRQVTEIKLSALQQYPYIYEFLRKATTGASVEEIKNRFPTKLTALTTRIYQENIDYSLFRKDIDLHRTMEMIQWVSEGATQKVWQHTSSDLATAVKEYNDYMDLLQQLIYT